MNYWYSIKYNIMLLVSGGFILNAILGSIYLWGNITPLVTSYLRIFTPSITYSDTISIYSAMLGFSSTSMILSGYIQMYIGPRQTIFIGGYCMAISMLFSSFSTTLLPLLLSQGCLFGIGHGLCTTVPIKCVVSLAPFHQSFYSGIMISGIGCGTFLLSWLCNSCSNPHNKDTNSEGYYNTSSHVPQRVPQMYLVLCALYFIITTLTAFMISPVTYQECDVWKERYHEILSKTSNSFCRLVNFLNVHRVSQMFPSSSPSQYRHNFSHVPQFEQRAENSNNYPMVDVPYSDRDGDSTYFPEPNISFVAHKDHKDLEMQPYPNRNEDVEMHPSAPPTSRLNHIAVLIHNMYSLEEKEDDSDIACDTGNQNKTICTARYGDECPYVHYSCKDYTGNTACGKSDPSLGFTPHTSNLVTGSNSICQKDVSDENFLGQIVDDKPPSVATEAASSASSICPYARCNERFPSQPTSAVPPSRLHASVSSYVFALCMYFTGFSGMYISAMFKIYGATHYSSAHFLTSVGAVASIFSMAGRILWGYLGDKVGYLQTLCIINILLSISLFLYPFAMDYNGAAYATCTCCIFFCEGGNFALYYSIIVLLFGEQYASVHYGLFITAFTVLMVISIQLFAKYYIAFFWMCIILGTCNMCGILCAFYLLSYSYRM